MRAVVNGRAVPAGHVCAPPSKSMAHRLLICAALSPGETVVENLAWSADIRATVAALEALGAQVETGAAHACVRGVSPPFTPPGAPVDCNESGSTLRFMIPLFSLCGSAVLTGAARLFARPLSVYESIFAQQGLLFEKKDNCLTLGGPLAGGAFCLPGDVSSQFSSGLLFALPLLPGGGRVVVAPPFESKSYVALTRAAQAMFGVDSSWDDENTICIDSNQKYNMCTEPVIVEGDWSQAAVPAVIAAVRGDVRISGLARGSAQGDRVIVDVLAKCGAVINWEEDILHISHPGHPLAAPGDIDLADCPDLGPILCCLALFCEGETRLVNAGRLRIKESDRIASMETELRKLGASVASTGSSVSIRGGVPLVLDGGVALAAHNDHRVVMALSAAALCGGGCVDISGAEAINKSWPDYFSALQALGAEVELHE